MKLECTNVNILNRDGIVLLRWFRTEVKLQVQVLRGESVEDVQIQIKMLEF